MYIDRNKTPAALMSWFLNPCGLVFTLRAKALPIHTMMIIHLHPSITYGKGKGKSQTGYKNKKY
jgi:hypothetical protein